MIQPVNTSSPAVYKRLKPHTAKSGERNISASAYRKYRRNDYKCQHAKCRRLQWPPALFAARNSQHEWYGLFEVGPILFTLIIIQAGLDYIDFDINKMPRALIKFKWPK